MKRTMKFVRLRSRGIRSLGHRKPPRWAGKTLHIFDPRQKHNVTLCGYLFTKGYDKVYKGYQPGLRICSHCKHVADTTSATL